MSTHILLAIITSVLGLVTAAILALINSWVSTRAGVDGTCELNGWGAIRRSGTPPEPYLAGRERKSPVAA